MSSKWFGQRHLSSPSLHLLRQPLPHCSRPEREGGTAKLGDDAVHTSETEMSSNCVLPSFRSTHGASSLGGQALSFSAVTSSSPLKFQARFHFHLSLDWGLYYLKVRKVSSAEVCLGEKAEWFKRCHVRRRWRRVPSWYIREENVSSDVFVREGWISVQPTLFFSFFFSPSQILF